MTIAVIVYVLIVTIPLVAAAALTERVLKLWSLPVRSAWAVTAILIAAITARAITGQFTVAQAPVALTVTAATIGGPVATPSETNVQLAMHTLMALPGEAAARVAHIMGTSQNNALAILWAAMSLAVFGLICVVYLRLAIVRRGWHIADFGGERVRVSPHAGPALIGLIRPEIVVPRWALDIHTDDSRLIVIHEMEHRAARDPLLLSAMWCFVALIPWHPGAWYCLARMRLAIELDCDARVVRRGASLGSYAQLLVDQARARLGAPTHLWLGATPLSEPSSHLERRIRAMINPDSTNASRRPRTRLLRTATSIAVISLIGAVACDSHVPTAADISGLDAAKAEKGAMRAGLIDAQDPVFYVDGIKVVPAKAKAISSADIESMEVMRAADSASRGEIHIVTVAGSRLHDAVEPSKGDTLEFVRAANSASKERDITVRAAASHLNSTVNPLNGGILKLRSLPSRTGQPIAGQSDKIITVYGTPFRSVDAAHPLVVIDGVPSATGLSKVDPKRIRSIEILKGPAVGKWAEMAAARNGVIMITLDH